MEKYYYISSDFMRGCLYVYPVDEDSKYAQYMNVTSSVGLKPHTEFEIIQGKKEYDIICIFEDVTHKLYSERLIKVLSQFMDLTGKCVPVDVIGSETKYYSVYNFNEYLYFNRDFTLFGKEKEQSKFLIKNGDLIFPATCGGSNMFIINEDIKKAIEKAKLKNICFYEIYGCNEAEYEEWKSTHPGKVPRRIRPDRLINPMVKGRTPYYIIWCDNWRGCIKLKPEPPFPPVEESQDGYLVSTSRLKVPENTTFVIARKRPAKNPRKGKELDMLSVLDKFLYVYSQEFIDVLSQFVDLKDKCFPVTIEDVDRQYYGLYNLAEAFLFNFFDSLPDVPNQEPRLFYCHADGERIMARRNILVVDKEIAEALADAKITNIRLEECFRFTADEYKFWYKCHYNPDYETDY